MQEIQVSITGTTPSQAQAQEIALALASRDGEESIVIARHSRPDNACSPCCLKTNLGSKPGWEVYGESHGGRLKICINGDYTFICS